MYLLRIEVLRPISVLLELLAASVSEKLVVRNLNLERTRIPLVVEFRIIGVDERQLLICRPINISAMRRCR